MAEPRYALGFGCERGVRDEAVTRSVLAFLDGHDVPPNRVRTIATASLKRDEEGLLRSAERMGWELVFYPVEQLREVEEIPNPNPVVERCVGTPGVAEPAAMLAASVRTLEVPKTVRSCGSRAITLALARYPTDD